MQDCTEQGGRTHPNSHATFLTDTSMSQLLVDLTRVNGKPYAD